MYHLIFKVTPRNLNKSEIATLLKDNSKVLHRLHIGPTVSSDVSSDVSSEVSSDVSSDVFSVDSNDSDSELCIKNETFSVNRQMILVCVLK